MRTHNIYNLIIYLLMSRFLTASLRAKSTFNIYWNTWRLVHPQFALWLHVWLHRLLGRRMERERRVASTWLSARCSCTPLASSLSSSTAGSLLGWSSVFGLPRFWWCCAAALTEPLLGHAKEGGGTRLRFVVITFACCRLARRCGLQWGEAKQR